MKLVLASASPRRSQILNEYGYEFDVLASSAEEIVDTSLSPNKVAESLAQKKARDVFSRVNRPTLAADTIVVFDGEILGKPKSAEHSVELLKKLSGNRHEVITAVAIIDSDRELVFSDTSVVVFNTLSSQQIEEYTSLGLGMDKAGGYGIQDGYNLVKSVEGSYYNVVGLPIERVQPILDEMQIKRANKPVK